LALSSLALKRCTSALLSLIPDQTEAVIRLLDIVGLSTAWKVLPPEPVAFIAFTVIKNNYGQRLVVPISSKDIGVLEEWEMIGRIRNAIAAGIRWV
jgi:hypothetical protein